MKITVIYATGRKERSTTYHLIQKVIEELKEQDGVSEFFLPRDMSHFCCGCFQCFEGFHEKCPGYAQVEPIREAMNTAELIIFAVPVYVYHAPAQIKALLDHFGWQWSVHQLNEKMFTKQALIVSTAAGAGMKSAIKDVKDSMDFWCVGRVYTYSKALWAAHWTELNPDTKLKMEADMVKIAQRIKVRQGKVVPRLKVKMMFYGCRLLQKKVGLNSADVKHWQSKGWLDKKMPW